MSSLNKVMILGRLGQDPEVRYMPNGGAVTNLSVATTETWKDKQGVKHESTEWHKVVLFGKAAEIAGEYLKKGNLAYFEGKNQTEKYTDKDGIERYMTKVVCRDLKLMPNASDSNDKANYQPKATTNQSLGVADLDDDIPF